MKKKLLTSLIAASVAIMPFIGNAQLQTPQPSPTGTIKQIVGVSEISIEYSRPSAKGRKIFGSLVPFNKVWRTGANKATSITFSDDVSINDTKVAKGKYSIFTIPSETEWTIIINKNPELWGEEDYRQEDDAARVKVKPSTTDMTETFTMNIGNITNNTCTVELAWEKTKASFSINIDTDAKVMSAIKDATNSTWRTYYQAANYILVNNNKELEMGKDLINKSIALKETYANYWVKAQIMAKLNDFNEALAAAEKSKAVGIAEGENSNYRYYKDAIDKGIAEYKPKATVVKGKKK